MKQAQWCSVRRGCADSLALDGLLIRHRIGCALIGLLLAIPAFAGNVVGFYFVLATCRAENATRFRPRAHMAITSGRRSAFGGVLGIAVALLVLGLLGIGARAPLAVGLFGWVFWLAFALAILGT
jgi:hypothetical protein